MKTKLQEIREAKKLTREAVGQAIGISAQRLYRIEVDKTELTLPIALSLCGFYNIEDLNEIFTEDYFLENTIQANLNSLQNKRKVYKAPVIDWSEIGTFPRQNIERTKALETLKKISNLAFAVAITEKAANSRFLEGDHIIVDPNQMPKNGDYCLVDFDDKGMKILTLLYKENGEYHFMANGTVKHYLPESQKNQIIGKIIELICRL